MFEIGREYTTGAQLAWKDIDLAKLLTSRGIVLIRLNFSREEYLDWID